MNDDGTILCPVCKGNCDYTIDHFCKHCLSNGRLDWIANAKGGALIGDIWLKKCEECNKVSFILLRKPLVGASIFACHCLKPNGDSYIPLSRVSCFFCGDKNIGNTSEFYKR